MPPSSDGSQVPDDSPSSGLPPHEPGDTGHPLSRARLAAGILYLITVALIAGLALSAIRTDYDSAYREAATQTSTLVTALEEHVVRTVSDTERVLDYLDQRLELGGGIEAFTPSELDDLLRSRAAIAGHLESLFVIGANGKALASSLRLPRTPIDLRDREYFQQHRNEASTAIHVGQRIVSRLTGRALFTASRRISREDGKFDGVLAGAIETNYFQRFYDRLQLPANSSILIARTDASLLVRYPESANQPEHVDLSGLALFREQLPRSPAGTYEAVSPLDNLDRIISYRSASGMPLVVALSIPRDVALQRWRVDAWRKAGFATAMVLLLTWLALVMQRQLGRVERAEAEMKASQARFRDLAMLSNDGFWEQDAEHRFRWLGERLVSQMEWLPSVFLARKPWELPAANLTDADWSHHRSALANAQPFRDFALKLTHGGQPVWLSMSGNPLFDDRGRLTGYHGTVRDVTDEREQHAEMTRRALLDPLTRLPNRELLRDRLDRAIAAARRGQTLLALLFIDLDGFKPINDRHGHHVGDQVLRNIATALLRGVREVDTVARIGGDEFVVLLQDVSSGADAESIARKLLNLISEIQTVEGTQVRVTASIGIALFPEHGDTADRMMRAADEAMYSVKGAGRADIALATG
jgi:diguanylate cyclase (GGDEF)-like protein/PAS domain S-box-containing protein